MKVRLFVGVYCLFFPLISSAFSLESKETIRVPVRIHLTTSSTIPHLNADISSEEISSVFENVNLIWKKAKIEFFIESVVAHPAKNEQLYLQASNEYSALNKKQRKQTMSKVCRIKPRSKSVINLCIVGRMSGDEGGLTYRYKKHSPLVVWPLELKQKKNHKSATLAHEFGHFLGLSHNSEKNIYLMKGKGNNIRRVGKIDKIRLTNNEIKRSRKIATIFTLYQTHQLKMPSLI